jgi:HPt (histidine-containing phosphotransfer) domain-containing protein
MSGDLFDKEALIEELDYDWEFLEKSIEILKEESGELLAQLREGLTTRDADAIWRGAHTVKSMVGNFFAEPVFELADTIETRGRATELEGLENSVEELASALTNLTAGLEALLASSRD